MNTIVRPQLQLIAGQRDGVKIYCSPQAFPVYQELVNKSKNSNYWADLIVRGIKGLKSGAINCKDVFVRTSNVNRGLQDFQILLPGCTVFAQRNETGSYIISRIDAAGDFDKQQERFTKPGLYKAKFARAKWTTALLKDGRISSGNNVMNVIGVSDKGYLAPQNSASYVGPRIKRTVNSVVEKTGFDLFFTPGDGRFGGLLNYRQALHSDKDKELHESAVLLADSMKTAVNTKDVLWFSDMGGSAVLTQAMKILATHNVKLSGHSMFLHRPTTRKDTIYKLSQKLDMTLDRDFTKTEITNLNELIGASSLTLPFLRKANETGYTYLNGAVDVVKGVSSGKAVIAAGAAVGALCTAAAATSFPAIATVIGAIQLGSAVVGAVPVASANMPDLSDKIKSHF